MAKWYQKNELQQRRALFHALRWYGQPVKLTCVTSAPAMPDQRYWWTQFWRWGWLAFTEHKQERWVYLTDAGLQQAQQWFPAIRDQHFHRVGYPITPDPYTVFLVSVKQGTGHQVIATYAATIDVEHRQLTTTTDIKQAYRTDNWRQIKAILAAWPMLSKNAFYGGTK